MKQNIRNHSRSLKALFFAGVLFSATTGYAQKLSVTVDAKLGQIAVTDAMEKGDLYTRDGANEVRLSAGLDGQLLRVNPLTSTGLEYHGTINNVKTVLGDTAAGVSTVACTAFGKQALQNLTTGTSNSAFGEGSLRTLATSNGNTAIGFSALGGAVNPISCTAVGSSCGGGGTANVTIGSFTGVTLSSGVENVCMGNGAFGNSNGNRNTVIGHLALNIAAGGASNNNIAIGHSAMGAASSVVSQNIAIGTGSLPTSQGLNNICIGTNSGGTLFGGNSNILIGNAAGSGLAGGGSGNIVLGNISVPSGAGNATFIANVRTTGVASGVPVVVGLNNEIGIAPSSKRFKDNIVDIKTLGTSDRFGKLKPVGYNYKKDEKKRQQFGLIAEELYNIFPEMVAMGAPEDFEPQVQDLEIYDLKLTQEERNAKINLKRTKSKDLVPFAIRYEQLIPILISEVQDLRLKVSVLESMIVKK